MPIGHYIVRSLNTAPSVTIPGLRYIPHFLNGEELRQLYESCVDFRDRISNKSKISAQRKGRTYLLKQHNLSSDESYQILAIEDENSQFINGQYFNSYGGTGHELTYCIGNKNTPQFVRKQLISKVEKLGEIVSLQASNSNSPLNWNFTYNYYTIDTLSGNLAGFPFHVDTPSNGEITAICTVHSEATLEMRKLGTDVATFSLTIVPGSFLLLSGESRWKWEHRIVPKQGVTNKTFRISAVLGCLH